MQLRAYSISIKDAIDFAHYSVGELGYANVSGQKVGLFSGTPVKFSFACSL